MPVTGQIHKLAQIEQLIGWRVLWTMGTRCETSQKYHQQTHLNKKSLFFVTEYKVVSPTKYSNFVRVATKVSDVVFYPL